MHIYIFFVASHVSVVSDQFVISMMISVLGFYTSSRELSFAGPPPVLPDKLL